MATSPPTRLLANKNKLKCQHKYMHTSGKGCCDVAYQSQFWAWTNWQQWAVHRTKVWFGNHTIQRYALIPRSPSQHFSPLGTSLNLVKLFSFKLEWRALLTNSKHHKPVTPSYYLGTFQTVLEMQHSGTVFLLQCYHSTCNNLYVSQRCKTALENIRKTATFVYTCIWEIQGLQLRQESQQR